MILYRCGNMSPTARTGQAPRVGEGRLGTQTHELTHSKQGVTAVLSLGYCLLSRCYLLYISLTFVPLLENHCDLKLPSRALNDSLPMVNYVANERHYPCNHRDVKINKYPLKVGPMRSEYEADTGEAKAPWQRPCRCVEGELLHVYTGDARRE